ncbi:MAG: hypothetical protein KF787_02955 [Phycisphaeraceae bacterium]|nr:hypothetical protein [Phycisphaerae bacterium]MBX3391586.1 hypothetical protein [Phycisphaeraceae bacterium]
MNGPLSATLAQIPTPVSVPPLPSPPAIERYLFEDAWAIATPLAVAAAVAIFTLLRRQEGHRALVVGGVLAAIAAAVALTGWFVRTPREMVRENTRSMITAVADGDTNTLTRLIEPQARLVAAVAVAEADDREEILSRVRSYEAYRGSTRDLAILELQASQDGPNSARTQVLLRAWTSNFPVFSWWRLDFRRGSDGSWACRRIELLWISSVGSRR